MNAALLSIARRRELARRIARGAADLSRAERGAGGVGRHPGGAALAQRRRPRAILLWAALACVALSGCSLFRSSEPEREAEVKPSVAAPAPPQEEEFVGPPEPEGPPAEEIVGPPAPPPEAEVVAPRPGAAEPGEALLGAFARQGIAAHASARGVVVVLPETVFDYGTSDLPRESRRRLREVARTVVEHAAGTRVSVEGHTDSIGAELYNKGLSERRATAVAAELAAGGVARKLISARGFGSQRPIAPNARADGSDDAQGRARNRRVEVIVETGPVGAL